MRTGFRPRMGLPCTPNSPHLEKGTSIHASGVVPGEILEHGSEPVKKKVPRGLVGRRRGAGKRDGVALKETPHVTGPIWLQQLDDSLGGRHRAAALWMVSRHANGSVAMRSGPPLWAALDLGPGLGASPRPQPRRECAHSTRFPIP